MTEERSRLARELHDIVSHNLSVVVLQAGGARAQGERAPAGTLEKIEEAAAKRSSRCAACSACSAKTTRSDDALDAAARHRRSSRRSPPACERPGCRSSSASTATHDDLPPALDLSAYRIVQEALTNTLKHAGPAHAHVQIRRHDGRPDDRRRRRRRRRRRPRPGGAATASSGCASASRCSAASSTRGPRPEGGFAVHARLPLTRHDVISIVIADDQELVREGLRMMLDAEADLNVVGEAADGNQALAAARTRDPDVVLMDVRMPELDGIEATRATRRRRRTRPRARPHHLRPRRIRLPGAESRRERLPAQGRDAASSSPPPSARSLQAIRCSRPRSPAA